MAVSSVILAGDSASNVMAGQVTTVPMTLDHMIYHAQCVKRAVDRTDNVDMLFGTYKVTQQLHWNAIRIMKEGRTCCQVRRWGRDCRVNQADFNCWNTCDGPPRTNPQSIYKFGTYSVRAKEDDEAAKLIEDVGRFSKQQVARHSVEKI